MNELIHQLGIDWKLLLAQAVNFFILLFILKRFAFGPLIGVMRKRKDEIEKGIQFARDAESRIQRIEEEGKAIVNAANQKAYAVIAKAESEGKRRKELIVDEARAQSERILEEARKKAAEEERKLEDEVYIYAHNLVRLGIERVIGKMPSKESDVLIKEALEELRNVKHTI